MTDAAAAYETLASEFLQRRDASTIGTAVVDRWARTLGSGAHVLELGCGGGYPITRRLRAAGPQLRAIDSSPTLLATFRARFPDVPTACERVQDSAFFERHHDGVIAIGVLFLLPEADQHAVISRVADVLNPGGRFLFTAPLETGSWIDTTTGLTCRSLGQAAYDAQLASAGFRSVATFSDEGDNNYYDVERAG